MGKLLDFFAQHQANGEICKELQKLDNEVLLAWEDESASDHSPGPVKNGETLYRQMMNPTHYDAVNKMLKATAFSDTSDKGGSVNRAAYLTREQAEAAAIDRAAQINARKADGTQVELWNLIELNCSDVRQIKTPPEAGVPERRAVAVYDTAYQHDQSHSDICQIVGGKSTGRSVRSKLLDLANAYLRRQADAAQAA